MYTNIRKGKKILGYDFSLKLDWEGSVASDSVVKGVAKIPEVSTEEDDIEVEISVTSSPNTDVEDKVKAAMRKKGSETIKDKIKEFLNEIKTNYGKQE